MDVNKLANQTILPIKPYVPGKSVKQALAEIALPEVYKMASNENPRGASPKAKAKYQDCTGIWMSYQ